MVGSGLGKVLKNLSGSTQSCVHEGEVQGRDVSRALDLKKLLQHGFGFVSLACTRIKVSKSTSNGHDFACQSFRFVQSCDGLVEHPFLPKSDGETHVRQVIAGIELECLAELLDGLVVPAGEIEGASHMKVGQQGQRIKLKGRLYLLDCFLKPTQWQQAHHGVGLMSRGIVGK